MTLSEAAAERVREIMANKGDEIAGVRVGVENGGCAGCLGGLRATRWFALC